MTIPSRVRCGCTPVVALAAVSKAVALVRCGERQKTRLTFAADYLACVFVNLQITTPRAMQVIALAYNIFLRMDGTGYPPRMGAAELDVCHTSRPPGQESSGL